MTDFEPVDDAEWHDLRAFGPVEAHRRRTERQEAAQASPKPRRARRATKVAKAAEAATGARTVTVSELLPGMVIAGTGDYGVDRVVERVCADIEPPHTVHVWLEGIGDAWLLPPDARLVLA